jgi:hypothetical protein
MLMHMRKFGLAAVLLLAACGGGGDGTVITSEFQNHPLTGCSTG